MTPKRNTERVAIQKVQSERRHPAGSGAPAPATRQYDLLAVEEPLEIRLKFPGEAGRAVETQLSVTMRTPGDDFELAAGFLFAEGLIRDGCDIERITFCLGKEKEKQRFNVVAVTLRSPPRIDPARLARHFFTSSSCGVCGKASLDALKIIAPPLPPPKPLMDEAVLRGLAKKLSAEQSVFEKTGGLHAAGLFDFSGRLIGLREDVGRHNAVDKVIGEQVLAKKTPLDNCVLLVSGRASFEIMQKALAAGIPIVAAVGAPSSLAAAVAAEFNITLAGFLRADRFNLYAAAERIRI